MCHERLNVNNPEGSTADTDAFVLSKKRSSFDYAQIFHWQIQYTISNNDKPPDPNEKDFKKKTEQLCFGILRPDHDAMGAEEIKISQKMPSPSRLMTKILLDPLLILCNIVLLPARISCRYIQNDTQVDMPVSLVANPGQSFSIFDSAVGPFDASSFILRAGSRMIVTVNVFSYVNYTLGFFHIRFPPVDSFFGLLTSIYPGSLTISGPVRDAERERDAFESTPAEFESAVDGADLKSSPRKESELESVPVEWEFRSSDMKFAVVNMFQTLESKSLGPYRHQKLPLEGEVSKDPRLDLWKWTGAEPTTEENESLSQVTEAHDTLPNRSHDEDLYKKLSTNEMPIGKTRSKAAWIMNIQGFWSEWAYHVQKFHCLEVREDLVWDFTQNTLQLKFSMFSMFAQPKEEHSKELKQRGQLLSEHIQQERLDAFKYVLQKCIDLFNEHLFLVIQLLDENASTEQIILASIGALSITFANGARSFPETAPGKNWFGGETNDYNDNMLAAITPLFLTGVNNLSSLGSSASLFATFKHTDEITISTALIVAISQGYLAVAAFSIICLIESNLKLWKGSPLARFNRHCGGETMEVDIACCARMLVTLCQLLAACIPILINLLVWTVPPDALVSATIIVFGLVFYARFFFEPAHLGLAWRNTTWYIVWSSFVFPIFKYFFFFLTCRTNLDGLKESLKGWIDLYKNNVLYLMVFLGLAIASFLSMYLK